MRTPALTLAAAALAAVRLLTACTENASSAGGKKSDPRTITVNSSADACEISSTSAPAGTLTFEVTNTGNEVTEFYLLGEDGMTIKSEIENIGPSISRKLTVSVAAGSYVTACKPGMQGEGIRADFTVKPSGDQAAVSADEQQLVGQALTNYKAYVNDQSDQLVSKTQQFVDLYKAGKDDEARALYPQARMHWERIETVAESFGDLDPLTDAREADLQPGQRWTGWHRIEKDLWPPAGYRPLSPAERATYADDLMKNITTLDSRIAGLRYTVDQIANGSRALLEEVANGKVTGEEEAWSHTDLWDFQGNVEGAHVGWEGVKPIVERKDKALAGQLDARFAALQKLLDGQKDGDGFAFYDKVSDADRRALSDAVNALSEPLSRLTAVVLS
jgi:iron uptake system component EfeO